MVMEKLISCKKTKGTEFNSSEEEKFLRRLNQNRVPTLFALVIWVVGHTKSVAKGVKKVLKACRPWCVRL